MKIAIIGAGLSGLLSAYYLTRKFDVTVYEQADDLGGLSQSIDCEGISIEKYNHFFSPKDYELLRVLSELGLKNKLYWKNVKQVFISQDSVIEQNKLGDLFSLPDLSIKEKIKLAKFIAYNFIGKDSARLSQITISDWVKKECGEKVFYSYFQPLLKFKFTEYDDVCAIYLRSRIREGKNRRIGYLHGGTKVLFKKLKQRILDQGGRILLKTKVNQLIPGKANKWYLRTKHENSHFDLVVSAIPFIQTAGLYPGLFEQVNGSRSIKYLSINSCLLWLTAPLKDGYWLFTVDLPEKGRRIVVDTSALTKDNFIYFPVYKTRIGCSEREQQEIIDDCFECLKKINPDFNQGWVKRSFFFSDCYSEPILTRRFLDIFKNSFSGHFKGLYICELINDSCFLKSLNTAAIKSRIAANQIIENYVGNNSS